MGECAHVPAGSVHNRRRSGDGLRTELRAEYRWEWQDGCSRGHLPIIGFDLVSQVGVVLGFVGWGFVGQALGRLAHVELAGYHVRDEAGAVLSEEFDLFS